MKLILIRHGKPARHGADLAEGPPLSDLGRTHAEAVSHRIAAMQPDVLIASPLTRAFQTCEVTSEKTGQPIEVEPGIAEVDMGDIPYIFVEDIRAAGEQAWANFLADPIAAMGGNGVAFRARVRAGWKAIIERHKDKAKVAVFTHGFPINIAVGDSVGADLVNRLEPRYCSITRFNVGRSGRMNLETFNDFGHLAGEFD